MYLGGLFMIGYRIRLRNRLLQFFYKPTKAKPRYISADATSFFDELEAKLEARLAPVWDDIFN